ncbi:ABC-type cobalamin/Fe3+-siderophores transport system, ATPase component [Rubellimicrobium thermophilum DSM 16684]|uniref:ABC-type cobalamin/Fe3+-siderophores transport system, ATPase component n=1 Tax=Rubellimicrobium thermophilum DSM 16684 TaxID=1123069 RepID=S9R3Z4_9RHOB|nr:ABC transporter ATP-binding protein [Rubellimicrobium thermophilum]EPX86622.1 ABC-type cobalamin/Fe3+-siderophores transport system, ATPase component [Rubellimicrobium thermophilum DSM 16684]
MRDLQSITPVPGHSRPDGARDGSRGIAGSDAATPHLELRAAGWGPRLGPPVLRDVSLALPRGAVLGVVGPNGAGKSTLLRLIYRYLRPRWGSVHLDGRDLWAMDGREAARHIAAVLQEQPTDFALTVREIVDLGRAPHRRSLSRDGARDARVVEQAIERLSLGALADRPFGTLSGGERQRAMVARALAQEPALLVLDEPTNHLDIRHQLELLALIRDLRLTIVISLHDLNLAAQLCDRILLLQDGAVRAQGATALALDPATLGPVFGVTVRAETLAPSGRGHLTFHLTATEHLS